MTDELAHRLGLEAADIADLDRLLALMHDAPQPPAGGPEDDPEPPQSHWRHLVKGCAWFLLAALLLAATIAGLGATSAPPRPTDSPIPSNVNPAY